MSKVAAKNKNALQEAESRLYRQWSLAVTPISVYTVKVIDDIFKTAKRTIADKINSEAGSDQGLSSYDEKIYELYKSLMDIYNKLADVSYSEITPSGDGAVKIGDIWNGISAVIQSRVKLFEEHTSEPHGASAYINPIAAEKKSIVSKSIKTFSESFNNTSQRFKTEEQKSLIQLAVKKMLDNDSASGNIILNDVLDRIEQNCFSRFYEFYGATVRFALINLNDFYKRRELCGYYELLLEEHQILSSIINVQVDVLENTLSANLTDSALLEPVAMLKQAYEQLHSGVKKINLLLKTAGGNGADIEDYAPFCESITDRLHESAVLAPTALNQAKRLFDGGYALFAKNFEDLYNKNLHASIRQIDVKSGLYKCSKIIFENEELADEIIGEFAGIIGFYENEIRKERIVSKENREIIEGISETVAIKIGSLQESKQQLTGDMTRLLASFSSNKAVFSEAEHRQQLETVKQRLLAQLLHGLSEDRRRQAVVKSVFSNGFADDVLKQYNEKTARLWHKNLEALNKRLLKFKKDSLLFEISTFEEIINYSVSILRKSSDPAVIEFVKAIDGSTKSLTDILTKYGIEIIKPPPHEPFNGKEHDVLMAEANEVFKKGEIIKVMNCGYKQNGAVILRANVIAAK